VLAFHGRWPVWKWVKWVVATTIISSIASAIYHVATTWPQDRIKKYIAISWFAFNFTLFCIGAYLAPKEKRRKAAAVRSNLGAERCARCGAMLGEWDGQYHPGDVHFNPGSYLPKVSVRCVSCHAERVFYVNHEGRLFSRDILFGHFSSGGRGV